MSLMEHRLYEFGHFRLTPADRLLTRDGRPVPLTPKAFDVLVTLVSHQGHLVKKEELLREVWPDTFVEEGNLTYTVSLLRKALEDGANGVGYIDTVPKVGYRFSAPVSEVAPAAAPSTAAGVGRARLYALAAGVAALGLVGAALLLRDTGRPPTPPAAGPTRLDVLLPPNIEEGKEPTISADGRALAMTATADGKGQLMIRRLDSPSFTPVPALEYAWLPIWSPDGRSIAALQGTTLKRVDLASGATVDLCQVAVFAGGDWGPGGVILFASRPTGLVHRVPAAGGRCEPATTLDAGRGDTAHRWPSFLPDARRFLYTVEGKEPGLYVGSIDAPMRKRVLVGGKAGVYVPPGHLLFLRDTALMAQPFDLEALEVRGDPVQVVDNVGHGTIAGTGFSVSRTGSVVYRPADQEPAQLFWFDRDGRRLGKLGPGGSYRQVSLSPSGRHAVVSRRDPAAGVFDLWLLEVSTGTLSRLTSDPKAPFNDDASFSPDEKRMAFTSRNLAGRFDVILRDLADGAQRTLPGKLDSMPIDGWTPDGRFVLGRANNSVVTAIAVDGGAAPKTVFDARHPIDQVQVSPDGEWVAYNSHESGTFQIYVARFPSFRDRRQISVSGGVQPLWRADGRELFYLTLQGMLMAADVDADVRGDRSPPRALFDTGQPPSGGLSQFAVTADGQKFLVIQRQPQRITILMNWLTRAPGS